MHDKDQSLSEQHLRSFLNALQQWVQKIRAGELTARIEGEQHPGFAELSQDFHFVAEMLYTLARDAELQLQRHTKHIAQKNKSLETLYDVVTNINMARDTRSLLTHFLHTMTEIAHAHAATVYLKSNNGTYSLISGMGINPPFDHLPPHLPNATITPGQQQTIPVDFIDCPNTTTDAYFDSMDLSILVVPLQYRGAILGVYNLYMRRDQFSKKNEYQDLFTSIGRHLGIAVEKARLDKEANLIKIIQERTNFANELHDSLAQTLASVKYQVRALDGIIHQDDEAATWQGLERIESTIDEAHSELRSLIAHFRSPVEEGSLMISAEQIVERFKRDSNGMHIYLQKKEWPDTKLPMAIESQVLRIIQEALTNARKHSKASAVRIWMNGDETGHYTVLIEDDGVGLPERRENTATGEHVGLSVMQNRADRIGGTLRVEGDAGEGVQVRLEFDYLPEAQQDSIDNKLTSKNL